jgi:hypothetical protein
MNKNILLLVICGLTSSAGWAADISVAASTDATTQASINSQNNAQGANLSLSGSAQQHTTATPASETAEESEPEAAEPMPLNSTASTAVDAKGDAVLSAEKSLAAIDAQKAALLEQGQKGAANLAATANHSLSGSINQTNSVNAQVQQNLGSLGNQANEVVDKQINAVATAAVENKVQGSVNQLVGSSIEGSVSNTVSNTINNSVQTGVEDAINSSINTAVDSTINTALGDSLKLGN